MRALAGCLVVLALAAPAHAGFVTRPYVQDARDDRVTLLWESDGARPATVRVEGRRFARTIDVAAAARVELPIDGLAPGARYRYEVRLGDQVARGELTTAPVPGAPVALAFVVYGDTRSGSEAHRQLVERLRAEVPDFLLGTGDLVGDGGEPSDWRTFFEVAGPLLADNVLYPALGNHDRAGAARSAEAWRARFAVPADGPDPERVYAFTHGPARFLVLDSNASSFALTDQTAWLERELAAARQTPSIRHVFVVMHHPPFSISMHGGHRELRERWTPLFERYGVAAVFSGHDHCYERAEMNGVHYFVSGGGGAGLYPPGRNPSKIDRAAVQRYERVHHYLRVHVVGGRVEVTAIRTDGTPIETFVWTDGAPDQRARAAATAVESSASAIGVSVRAAMSFSLP